jgi:UPF0176 protein
MNADTRVLLYYRFVPIANPESERDAQLALGKELGLLGRILIAEEGINGTVSGSFAATEAWKEYHRKHPLFYDVEFKEDPAAKHLFPRLSIRTRQEIITLGYTMQAETPTAPYIEPEDMRELLRKQQADPDPDTVILDTRSSYETIVGKFRGAIHLEVESFKEYGDRLDELAHLKDKKIITYCTGGIRCEKFTALMLEKGFQNVYQLHGGIIRYAHEMGGEGFEGQCYVFDDRIVAPVNIVDPVVIGHCESCQTPSEHMLNCANVNCNKQIILCEACAEALEGCCSDACRHAEHVRVYDGTGHYRRGVNGKLFVER